LERRVLIIGANGQDGTILRRVEHRDDRILAVGRNSSSIDGVHGSEGPGYSPETLDILLERISDFSPDDVYYLAAAHGAQTTGINENPELNRQRKFIDVEGLAGLMKTLGHLDKEVGMFFASSAKVFGAARLLANEDTPLNPACDYSKYKVEAMRFLEGLRLPNVSVTTGVLFHHHSSFRTGPYALNLIAAYLAKPQSKRSSSPIHDWSAAGDFSSAFEVCSVARQLVQRRLSGRFVIGSGVSKTLADIRDVAIRLLGEGLDPYTMPCVGQGAAIIADTVRLQNFGLRIEDKIIEVLVSQVRHLRGELWPPPERY